LTNEAIIAVVVTSTITPIGVRLVINLWIDDTTTSIEVSYVGYRAIVNSEVRRSKLDEVDVPYCI
jgi:hypothetical protein